MTHFFPFPSTPEKKNDASRFGGETGSKLSAIPRLQAEKHLKVQVPPLVAGGAVSFNNDPQHRQQHRQARDVRHQSEGGAWGSPEGVGQLPAGRSPYEDEVGNSSACLSCAPRGSVFFLSSTPKGTLPLLLLLHDVLRT